jgi:predicted DsbA family dithiol-disulfide isomerase
MDAVSIDVVSDVVCPWCFIGFHRVEEALRAFPGVVATVTYHPYLLDPKTPLEGADLRERLRAKYGSDPESMFRRVEAAAQASGVPLDFSRVRRTVNTLRAHTLLRHAATHPARTAGSQARVAAALFRAYFLEERDIGVLGELVEIAAAHGFAREEVARVLADDAELELTRREAEQAALAGITGVPFTVVDGRYAVSGAQPVEVFERALRRALNDGAESHRAPAVADAEEG